MRRLLALALTVALAYAPAQAQEKRGPYVGLGLVQIDYEDNLWGALDVSDADTAYKLVGGFRFNDKLAFEANYSDSAEFAEHISGPRPAFRDPSDSGFLFGDVDANYSGEFEFFELRVLAHMKYVVLGIAYFTSDFTARVVGNVASDVDVFSGPLNGTVKDSDNGYSIIIGAQFDIENWSIRPEYEYFDVSSPADATSLGVQIHYTF